MRDRSKRPTVSTAQPTIGKILYRPVLVTSWPLKMNVSSMPATNGNSSRPAAVGVAPCTVCR